MLIYVTSGIFNLLSIKTFHRQSKNFKIASKSCTVVKLSQVVNFVLDLDIIFFVIVFLN